MSMKREEILDEIKNEIGSPVFYEHFIEEQKNKYARGLGLAHIKDLLNEVERKNIFLKTVSEYVEYLEKNKKIKLKSAKKILKDIIENGNSLLGHKAYNKDWYEDASIDKYIQEDPYVDEKSKEYLKMSLPYLICNFDKLEDNRRYSRYTMGWQGDFQKKALLQSFANASMANVLENILPKKINEYFASDIDFFSEENQMFFTSDEWLVNITSNFQAYPLNKLIQKILPEFPNIFSDMLLKSNCNKEDFDNGFEQILSLTKSLAIRYHKEDFIRDSLEKLCEKKFRTMEALEIEDFLNKKFYRTEKLRVSIEKLILKIKPSYSVDLIKKNEAVEDLGNETIYVKTIKFKEMYMSKIFNNPALKGINKENLKSIEKVTRISLTENQTEYYLKIYTKSPLMLSANEIIEILNDIYKEDSPVNNDILYEQTMRTIELNNTLKLTTDKKIERAKSKI